MTRFAKTLWRSAGVVALLAAGVMSPRASHAGLVYDVRFDDGSSTRTVTGPTSLSVQLWAQVSGADANHANDALLNSYQVLQSAQVNGGAITGGIVSGVTGAAFSDTARNGQANHLNADGVIDWGSNSSSAADPGYMFARASNPGVFGGGATGQAVNAQTWEFLVATYTVDVTGLVPGAGAGAETRFVVTEPDFPTSPIQAYAIYVQDGATSTLESTNAGNAYGSFVTIVVPEPTTLALAALGGMTLLARRRR